MRPVWQPLPQTPQAAEHCALAIAMEMAGEGAKAYSDCENVVQAYANTSKAMGASRPYAGIVRHALINQSARHVREVKKVKAHVDVHDTDVQDEWSTRANQLADEAAGVARIRLYPK